MNVLAQDVIRAVEEELCDVIARCQADHSLTGRVAFVVDLKRDDKGILEIAVSIKQGSGSKRVAWIQDGQLRISLFEDGQKSLDDLTDEDQQDRDL